MQYLYAFILLVILIVITLVVAFFVVQRDHLSNVPKDVPWVELRGKTIFPKLRASLRSVVVGKQGIKEGYEKYTKHGKPFVLPGVHWADVVLPPSCTRWLIAQPDHIVSVQASQNEVMGLQHVHVGESLVDVYDFGVIRRDLTRQMSNVLPAFLEELDLATGRRIGTEVGKEWSEIRITKAIQHTTRRALKRVFVGLPFCRNENWLRQIDWYEQIFGTTSMCLLLLVPRPLQPILAPIMALPYRLMQWIVIQPLIPEIKERIAAQQQALLSPDTHKDTSNTRPNDTLQWVLESAAQRSGWSHINPRHIATKTLLFNLFAMHTTTISALEILINILTYSSAPTLLTALREEAATILPQLPSNPLAVRQMTKMDSVIREVLRFDPMFGHSLNRVVLAPEGVTTPDGVYLPQGTHVSVIVTEMQRDGDVQGEGGFDEFQPLRYYDRSRSADEKERQKLAVQVGEQFLSFGLGRHACPGRFFAVQSMKLILGHLLLHYDIEPLTERPKMVEIGDTSVPSEKMKVKLRRRRRPSKEELVASDDSQ